jgi:hypothetical protein
MTPAITARQRDALYDQIVERLSGIDDIWLAVCAENYEAAARLGCAYSDELRLLTDDLGWGEGPGEVIELSAPPDVLRRALSRLRDAAMSHAASQQKDWSEFRESEARNHLVVEACSQVLGDLARRPLPE